MISFPTFFLNNDLDEAIRIAILLEHISNVQEIGPESVFIADQVSSVIGGSDQVSLLSQWDETSKVGVLACPSGTPVKSVSGVHRSL